MPLLDTRDKCKARHSVSRVVFATVFKQTQNISEVLKQIMTLNKDSTTGMQLTS